MLAELVDINLPFRRGGDWGQFSDGFTSLGITIRLIDDEPDLVEPALQHPHARVFHQLLAINTDGFARFLRSEKTEVFRPKLLLQRS